MKPQFILEKRQFDNNGTCYIEKKHFPITYSSIQLIPNLSNNIDYSLICNDTTILTGLPNTFIFVLILCEN